MHVDDKICSEADLDRSRRDRNTALKDRPAEDGALKNTMDQLVFNRLLDIGITLKISSRGWNIISNIEHRDGPNTIGSLGLLIFRLEPSSRGGYEFTLTDTEKVWQEKIDDFQGLNCLKVERGAASVDLDCPERGTKFVLKMNTDLSEAATLSALNPAQPIVTVKTTAYTWQFCSKLLEPEQSHLVLAALVRWQMQAASALKDQNTKSLHLVEELSCHIRAYKCASENNETYHPTKYKAAYDQAIAARVTSHSAVAAVDPLLRGAKALCEAASELKTDPLIPEQTSKNLSSMPEPAIAVKPNLLNNANRLKRREELQKSLAKRLKR